MFDVGKEDFFDFDAKYNEDKADNSWFDDLDNNKPKPKKQDNDFDFGFDNPQPTTKNTASSKKQEDLFDFGSSNQNTNDLIQMEPSKPKFDDYFPSYDNEHDDNGDDNLGLISNLKKLYEKDGVVDNNPVTTEGILQPEVPKVLQKQQEFTPEVKIKGEDFWQKNDQANMNFQYQPQNNYYDLSSMTKASSNFQAFPNQNLMAPNVNLGRSNSAQNQDSQK